MRYNVKEHLLRNQLNLLERADQEPTFHKFTQLPAELRLIIWPLTWQPRTVQIRSGKCRDPLPASACVHWESRQETLRFYKAMFTTTPPNFMVYPPFYINDNLDTVDIPCHVPLVALLPGGDLATVQNLSVPEWYIVGSGDYLMADLWARRDKERADLLDCFYDSLLRTSPTNRHFWVIQCLLATHFPALRKISLLGYKNCGISRCTHYERCILYLRSGPRDYDSYTRSIQIPLVGEREGQEIEVEYLHYRRGVEGVPESEDSLGEVELRRLANSLEWAFGDSKWPYTFALWHQNMIYDLV
ncbi:hypothetical protein M426DRAFT_15972 [Hypoxylon sp. CI-4A]|nr:hypothetical protein M426DRAFT_15972 [Hypoxylon sp. CI-4A]